MDRPHKSTTHEELFFQIREPHTDKKGKKYKAATVFARECEKDSGCWHLSIARCSEEDNFCRATGRSIARRRWFAFEDSECLAWWEDHKPSYDDAKAFYTSI